MISEMRMQSILGSHNSNEYEELAMLLRERTAQEWASDSEKELSLSSGSDPPIVEASILDSGGGHLEELRSDPAYISYYYQNVHLSNSCPPCSPGKICVDCTSLD
ncbi:pumilio-like protein 1-like [Forsythia ovata]|uniref:Pumilio-like protein 1-like n=1 Tax=Forsythia ovata TaxID=205694 RepID=A0ABD1WIV6_9LAMI